VAPVVLTFHITGSKADPRHVLQLYANDLHPQYFSAPNENVHTRASGMGAYAATQGSLSQPVDGMPLIDTMKQVGFAVNWDATFWWPYIMMIAPTIASGGSDSTGRGVESNMNISQRRDNNADTASNFTELWGSSLDKEPGYNNRLSQVHVHASYAIRDQ
jgi:hypothetical protein